ncbi:hypothetical protein BIV25_25980 [Streptomyces sp. MUSC 14]|uniref:hypothetical protein n=1 Tax=Streptomyces sp. MUSC 14 TaxID=1354889 RepID=UPI0008F57FBD|nr:hypothetical protein [Streptomyces sp. MUSC 14]OIJ93234.1 hypothetical protein BIV25_25980 [Streptomyces sp. MUSC 14]
MRWLMSRGERTRPDTPRYAECPAPDKARALALVDDFAHLFTVLREWREVYGDELTAWAMQVEADSIENLPAELIDEWEWQGDPIRIDTERGGYLRVSDYRDVPVRPGISTHTTAGLPLWTTTP